MPELLQKNELSQQEEDIGQDTLSSLGDFEHILTMRKQQLANIKKSVSKKLFFSLEEKIETERQEFLRLLGLSHKHDEIKKQYSNILDSQYFEQKFMQ